MESSHFYERETVQSFFPLSLYIHFYILNMNTNAQHSDFKKITPDESQPIANQQSQYAEGRWDNEEHRQFLLGKSLQKIVGVIKHGKDWKKIDELISTRNSTQIRSHAQKYFQKLFRQQKEQKKGRYKNKMELGELEKELAMYFTMDDMCKQTPIEFVNIMKRASGIQENIGGEEEHKEEKKAKEKANFKLLKQKPSMQEHQIEEVEEESYLMRTLKNNPNCLRDGHEFYQLIDFGRESLMKPEENETAVRKRSFALPDDYQDEQKLKETLQNFHDKLGNSA